MAHKRFVTIRPAVGAGWVALPTTVRGAFIEPKEAEQLFNTGKLRAIGRKRHRTRMAAQQAAKLHF